jgi:hypothetical protein
MAYDPAKAATYNRLIRQGLSSDAAAAQAGITENESNNYSIGDNGEMGALVAGGGKVAGVDYEKLTPQEIAEQTRYNNGFESANYAQSPSGNPAQQPPAKPITYTTTSTETVSGGGSTTITAGARQPTPESQRLAGAYEAKNAEYNQFVKDNPSDFARRKQGLPPMTPEEKDAYNARLQQLNTEKEQLKNQQIDAETPGTATVTTTPNTTTTTQTVETGTSATNSDVNIQNDPATFQQAEGQLATTPGAATPLSASTPAPVAATPAAAEPLSTLAPADVAASPPVTPTAAEPLTTLAPADVAVSPPVTPVEAAPPATTSPASPPASAAEVLAQQNAAQAGSNVLNQPPPVPPSQAGPIGAAFDDAGFLNPGYTLDEDNNPVFVGGNFVEPATAESAAASREAAIRAQAKKQATIQARYKQPGNQDWRVRLSLAPGAQYLYNAKPAGVLAPLAAEGGTDGVIFPYTPNITTAYTANYEQYDLIHSNYRGVFYKNSRVSDIQVRGMFTAQDTTEANYLLAVIHFFRSVTKMFYGQDAQRGAPPPICLLNGFGGYQFSDHPVVVTSFNYSLPNDVDYIRTTNPNNFGLNLNNRYNPAGASLPAGGALAGLNRLLNAIPGGLNKGALPTVPAPNTVAGSVTNNVPASYVPTKMEIDITLIPVQTRSQVSNQFSLKGFANGDLLKGGFW